MSGIADIFRQMQNNDVRQPYVSEHGYFASNPHVAGMAAQDNNVVLNPYSQIGNQGMAAVEQNERHRIKMRNEGYSPSFEITPQQKAFFGGTAYANDPANTKHTIISRILTGDKSVSPSFEQSVEAKRFKGF